MSLPTDMSIFRVMLAADLAEGWEIVAEDGESEPTEWIICEGGCDRALPVDEAEHAQCGSLLTFCGDCLADHTRTCLVCGAA